MSHRGVRRSSGLPPRTPTLPWSIAAGVAAPRTSLLVRLLNEGRALHGSRLCSYCENYPIYDWSLTGVRWQENVQPGDVGAYGDVLGYRPLRERLAARDSAVLSLPGLSADDIAVTAGATGAIHSVLSSARAVCAARRVLIPAPGFVGYRGVCEAAGLEHAPYPLDGRGLPRLDALCDGVGERDVLILNIPHNPTGAVPDTKLVTEIARIVRRRDGLLLVDCVYDALCYDTALPRWDKALSDSGAADATVFVNSVSKAFGVPGLRVGWVSARARHWIAALEGAIEHTMICVPTLNQRLAMKMLSGESALLVNELRRRRDLLCNLLRRVPGACFRIPPAGTTLWVRLDRIPAVALCEKLLREEGILLLPGEGYYRGDREHLRLSFGYPDRDIVAYVDALARVTASWPTSTLCDDMEVRRGGDLRRSSSRQSISRVVERSADLHDRPRGTCFDASMRSTSNGNVQRAATAGPGGVHIAPTGNGSLADGMAFSDGLAHALSYLRRYVAAQAIYHLAATTLWSHLESEGSTVEEAAEALGLDKTRLEAFLIYCRGEGLVTHSEGRYCLSREAASLAPYRGWFRFFVGGYGDTFRHLGSSLSVGSSLPPRNYGEVSGGSCDISRFGALPLTQRLLSKLGSVSNVLDCGCGTGLYLAALCEDDPRLSGVGFEPRSESRDLAERHIADLGLTNRVRILQADAISGLKGYVGEPPQAILFAFVLHEIVGQDGASGVTSMLRSVRNAFCDAAIIVIETIPFGPDDGRMHSCIGRGYYNTYFLTQAMTDQRLLPPLEWIRIFSSAGFEVADIDHICREADPTRSEVGFLLKPRTQASECS
jgi:2-ketoarginine methyltransferase